MAWWRKLLCKMCACPCCVEPPRQKWRDHFTHYELAIWDHMLFEGAKRQFDDVPDDGLRSPDIAERRRLIWDEIQQFAAICESASKAHPWMIDEGWKERVSKSELMAEP